MNRLIIAFIILASLLHRHQAAAVVGGDLNYFDPCANSSIGRKTARKM